MALALKAIFHRPFDLTFTQWLGIYEEERVFSTMQDLLIERLQRLGGRPGRSRTFSAPPFLHVLDIKNDIRRHFLPKSKS